MKKLTALLLALSMLLAAGSAAAAPLQVKKLENGTAEITKYAGKDTKLEIPGEINGMIVTSIGDEAFSECEGLITVILPDSLETIGKGAFLFCKNLERIRMPSGVRDIGEEAFRGCKNLKRISIAKSSNSSITHSSNRVLSPVKLVYSYQISDCPEQISSMETQICFRIVNFAND